MTVRINIFVYPLLMLAFAFAAGIKFEASWGTRYMMTDIPYQKEIFLVFMLLAGLFLALKVVNKWMGIRPMISRRQSELLFDEPISKDGMNRMVVYNILESILYILFAGCFYWFTENSHSLSYLCAIVFLEIHLFQILNRKRMRVIAGKGSMMYVARNTVIFPYKGLKSIEKDFDVWFFNYKSGKIVKLPLIHVDKENRAKLLDAIKSTASTEGVFFSDTLLED